MGRRVLLHSQDAAGTTSPSSAIYLLGGFVVADAFAEAARIGGCVKYTTGLGPNVGIDVISADNEFWSAQGSHAGSCEQRFENCNEFSRPG